MTSRRPVHQTGTNPLADLRARLNAAVARAETVEADLARAKTEVASASATDHAGLTFQQCDEA
jgi:hypothetical protein